MSYFKRLGDDDFKLFSEVPIMLNTTQCLIVLFHADNVESKNLLEIWESVAQQGFSDTFASCDLVANRQVQKAFNLLNMKNTSLHWAALKTVPFIMVYQNGFPVAFYNGERSTGSIIDFSLTLACKSDYREFSNIYGGMEVDKDIEMKGISEYGDSQNPFRNESLQYTNGKYIRGYDKDDRIVEVGSTQSKREAQEEDVADQSLGVALPPPTRLEPTAAPTPISPEP